MTDSGLPQYPSDFLVTLLRYLTNKQVAASLGVNAAFMLTIVAVRQHENGWKPVTFFNSALQKELGIKTFRTFDAARTTLIDAKLLFYKGDDSNQRTPGIYWAIPFEKTLTPDHCQKKPMVDEYQSQKTHKVTSDHCQKKHNLLNTNTKKEGVVKKANGPLNSELPDASNPVAELIHAIANDRHKPDDKANTPERASLKSIAQQFQEKARKAAT